MILHLEWILVSWVCLCIPMYTYLGYSMCTTLIGLKRCRYKYQHVCFFFLFLNRYEKNRTSELVYDSQDLRTNSFNKRKKEKTTNTKLFCCCKYQNPPTFIAFKNRNIFKQIEKNVCWKSEMHSMHTAYSIKDIWKTDRNKQWQWMKRNETKNRLNLCFFINIQNE